ncbi:putative flippase GtrA [Burkholderia ambifaria]|nr:GtrA family protein [Burkholderia ambifaria]MDR6500451.1 putative flippase GtrA [Burkholderia ambifaria]
MMFSGYFIVSVISLCVDWLFFLTLSSAFQFNVGVSAWVAYLIGGVVNYALSRRFVFRSDTTGRRQVGEALLFAASCGLGSALTGGIVYLAAPVFGKMVAKASAVAVSFLMLYWVRRTLVFHWPVLHSAATATKGRSHEDARAGRVVGGAQGTPERTPADIWL